MRLLWFSLLVLGCGAPQSVDSTGSQQLEAPCVRTTDVRGIDVSSYPQVDIDFNGLASQGFKFAFIRVSDGEIQDPFATKFWAHAKQAGMIRSPYFFYYAWISAQGQADAYIQSLSAVGGLQPGDMAPMIDVEECTFGGPACSNAPKGTAAEALAGLQLITAQLERATGKKPIIYTNHDTWDNYLGGPNFNQFPLDLANVPASCPTVMARPWTSWLFLQDHWYNSYDTDYFNGTLADLIHYANTDELPGAAPVSSDPCAQASAGGLYCGESRQNGFPGGDASTLFDCENGATASATKCANGCSVAPAGQNDYCNAALPVPSIPPRPTDPCATATNGGLYCGGSTQFGFGGGDKNTLYDCENGATHSTTACPYGCNVAAQGENDSCNPKPFNPCETAAYGGLYCGGSTQNGFGGGDKNTLYDCETGAVKSSTACANGCNIAASGENDSCKPDPCISATDGGLFCGQSTQFNFSGGLDNYLYDCENHATQSKSNCANGCVVAPAGQNDHCK